MALTTDKLAFDVNDLPDGRKQLRAYVSGAEPEPDRDIEWSASTITGLEGSLPGTYVAFAAPVFFLAP